ncbi:MAG: YceI family protein [Fluviicola sp.]|nr:YceI family protein [Fluviicola sp.]
MNISTKFNTRKTILALAVLIGSMGVSFGQSESKIVSEKGHIEFLSKTSIEDISAHNSKIKSSLDMTSGAVIISVPMQSYKFENATMQKHYNSPKFLDTKQFPKSKFKGTITNLDAVDFSKDGSYKAEIKGELTLHGVTKPVTENATITVKGGNITLDSKMQITLADYKIAFEKGKPSKNIAKTIDVTTKIEFTK